MASRMLHYVLAVKIANEVTIDDMGSFILGSLLPDASCHSDGTYDIAHFKDIVESEGSIRKGLNWSLFEHKYRNKIAEDSLYIGYLCHLIADAVWFKKITDKYVRIYPKKERVSYIEKGYEDFQKMNSLLREEYSLICPSLQIPQISITEVNCNFVEALLGEFARDFESSKQYNIDGFSVYPYEAVKNFIDESLSVCVREINALRNKAKTFDPRIYYTESRP